jgi:hypothetical protein
MPEIKRTVENPPAGLKKAVISRSKSDQWATAKDEWVMESYYYASNKRCPCSPRTVANITVIVNTSTFEELEICNACAERYFGITLSGFIETARRRITKNIHLGINVQSLDYLLSKHIITERIYEYYQAAIKQRKNWHLENLRKLLNAQFVIFTAYENKEAFDMADRLLAYSSDVSDLNLDAIVNLWAEILFEHKPANIELLQEGLDLLKVKDYTLSDIQKGRRLLDKYIDEYWNSKFILLGNTKNRGRSKRKVPNCICLEGLEDAYEPYYADED